MHKDNILHFNRLRINL